MLFSSLLSHPLDFLFFIVALVSAITVHEFSHAFLADRLGDPTPRLQGRLTLNPLAHLDPWGTLMLLLVRFGWGKPVQFDPFNLENPRRDAALISIAGPVSNLITASIAAILLRIVTIATLPITINLVISSFLTQIILLNVLLAVFNFLPINPLDGFKIVWGLLPEDQAREWAQLERYGVFFLLLLVLPIFGGTAPVFRIMGPIINFFLNILLPSGQFI